jgi:ubiquinone/menaquinone biosynthesis C-methylase UbiE
MKIQPFEKHTKKYENWFERNKFVYLSELEAVRKFLPDYGIGTEIGVGSGKFASPLHIRFGLDPSNKMMQLAKDKGIQVVKGVAETLPYKSEIYDYVLMITTICFLDNIESAFKEIYRILKPNGLFINGFVNSESKLGKKYKEHKQENIFYRIAEFFSVDEVIIHLKKANFTDFKFTQTIFQRNLNEIKQVERVKLGYNEGSFVVIFAKRI